MIKPITKSPEVESQSQPIEEIRKKFRRKREWLLIEVVEMDEKTTTPLTGRLLVHSPHQGDIFKESIKRHKKNRKITTLIDYSEDLPKNMAIIF